MQNPVFVLCAQNTATAVPPDSPLHRREGADSMLRHGKQRGVGPVGRALRLASLAGVSSRQAASDRVGLGQVGSVRGRISPGSAAHLHTESEVEGMHDVTIDVFVVGKVVEGVVGVQQEGLADEPLQAQGHR